MAPPLMEEKAEVNAVPEIVAMPDPVKEKKTAPPTPPEEYVEWKAESVMVRV